MKTLFLPLLLLSTVLAAQQTDTLTRGQSSVTYRGGEKTTRNHVDFDWEDGDPDEHTLFGNLDLSGLWGGPTYNYTATGDDWALVRGGFGGFEFEDNVFIGYGGWASRDRFTTDDAPIEGDRADFKFRHGGLILAYSPSANNTIHPRFTAILGPGRIEGTAPDPENDGNTVTFKERMFVGQVMAGGELNIFQWFRLGIEGGYRFAGGVDVPGVSANDVSGAIVQVEARFGFSW